MNTARCAPLSEVAAVLRGVSFDKAEVSAEPMPGHVPILRAGNIDAELLIDRDLVWVPENRVAVEQRLQVGDIAICMSSGSQTVVGKTAPLRTPWTGSVGAFCAVVRPRTAKIVSEYLAFFLQSERFRAWTRQSTGANIKNIRKSELESFEVPLPPIGEQRRIVDLLTRAEGIVRLRREAQAKAAEIIPALFLDMFGDPATNPKGWNLALLGDMLAEPPCLGTMAKPSPTTGGWLDLRVANIQDGQLHLQDKRWLDFPADQVDRFSLRDGDLLLARAIGSLDHLGKAVIVQPSGQWTFDSHLMRLRVNRDRLLPEYLKAFLESASGREEFLKHTRRSAVQFNINGKEIRRICLPLPPIKVQATFVRRCLAVWAFWVQQHDALKKAEAVFQALLARTFNSESASTEQASKEAAVA